MVGLVPCAVGRPGGSVTAGCYVGFDLRLELGAVEPEGRDGVVEVGSRTGVVRQARQHEIGTAQIPFELAKGLDPGDADHRCDRMPVAGNDEVVTALGIADQSGYATRRCVSDGERFGSGTGLAEGVAACPERDQVARNSWRSDGET